MWHRSILETVRQERDRGLCLYGAGFWGIYLKSWA